MFVGLVGCDASDRPTKPITTSTAAPVTNAALPDGIDATVTSVTDGDTIRVHTDAGADERVRLTGIDTPETKDPRTVVECFGKDASARTASLLPVGTRVRLERDVELRDRYGRRLAYVWRADDALFVNESLVADGYAAPYRYPPNVKYADQLSALGATAASRTAGCGRRAVAPTRRPSARRARRQSCRHQLRGRACDANYAGACVPISSTDLDCADVGVRGFQVVGTDVAQVRRQPRRHRLRVTMARWWPFSRRARDRW